MNAETKLREAERQEEKRSGRSALPATMAAFASTTTTVTTTETVPLRKSSLKKGGRLVEKVGPLSPALVPGLCPYKFLTVPGAKKVWGKNFLVLQQDSSFLVRPDGSGMWKDNHSVRTD